MEPEPEPLEQQALQPTQSIPEQPEPGSREQQASRLVPPQAHPTRQVVQQSAKQV
jgi:hypothetical protein